MGPQMDIKTARENAIINGILSGDNACGALVRAIQEGRGAEFLREKIAPTIRVQEEEKEQLRRDWLAVSGQVEACRQALEYIASNARASAPAHIEAFALRALGRN